MNAIEKIISYINKLENKQALKAIGQAVAGRLEELDRPKGQLTLELIDGFWYALEPGQSNLKTGRNLGKQLTMTEVLKQLREKAPQPTDFEVTAKQATELRSKDPERVGWWHETNHSQYITRYYDIPPYQNALARWKQDQAIAHDPIALAYRMSLVTVRQLRQLEESGFEIVYPE